MNEQEIRQDIHDILDRHADALAAIRSSRAALTLAFEAGDSALVSAIEANRAALRLLNRIMDEGIER